MARRKGGGGEGRGARWAKGRNMGRSVIVYTIKVKQ